jgi:hypothetical protein
LGGAQRLNDMRALYLVLLLLLFLTLGALEIAASRVTSPYPDFESPAADISTEISTRAR